jgi:hypothetical protein
MKIYISDILNDIKNLLLYLDDNDIDYSYSNIICDPTVNFKTYEIGHSVTIYKHISDVNEYFYKLRNRYNIKIDFGFGEITFVSITEDAQLNLNEILNIEDMSDSKQLILDNFKKDVIDNLIKDDSSFYLYTKKVLSIEHHNKRTNLKFTTFKHNLEYFYYNDSILKALLEEKFNENFYILLYSNHI